MILAVDGDAFVAFEDTSSDDLEREALDLLTQVTTLRDTSYPLLKELGRTDLAPAYRMELEKTLRAVRSEHQQLHDQFMRRHEELQRRKGYAS
jgi:hypothetical protein